MLRFRLILPLAAVAFAHCGGTVKLENRPCPCSDDWTCCARAKICVPQGEQCPAPPKVYCEPQWTATEAWCVLDKEVSSADVCHFADSPTIQIDLDSERDECAKQPDIESLYRPFDCTVSFSGKTIEGMVVDHGVPLVMKDADRCRLRATLLMRESPP